MGITGEAVQRLQTGLSEDALRASAHYVGDDARVSTNPKVPTTMRRGGGSGVLTPGRAPPDLPSLLLDSRIVYIGMPLVASVTELVISELLWLNYNQPEKPVYVYINSAGSQSERQEAVGFETEAYAILDTMQYIRPDIYTVVIGQAFGNACMLLASGKKGNRAALPHSRIKMAPPRLNRAFGRTTDLMIKANELEANTDTYVEFMAKFTGRDLDEVAKDCGRDKYFTPAAAIEYGIVDRIISPEEDVAMDAKDYEGALDMMRSQRSGARAPSGPEAGSA